MEPIILFGASGHAKHIINIIENEKKYLVVGVIDAFRKPGEEFFGVKILGSDDDIQKIASEKNITKGIIAVGDNFKRKHIAEFILNKIAKFQFISTIHPSAQIGKNVKIGAGTVVMPGAIIAVDSIIGDHCIINTNASVDHDCKIGNFSSVLPGAILGGNVEIGDVSAIGLGANIIHGISIGNNSVIGAGSLVLSNFEDDILAYGSPAKIIRKRTIGEKYL